MVSFTSSTAKMLDWIIECLLGHSRISAVYLIIVIIVRGGGA